MHALFRNNLLTIIALCLCFPVFANAAILRVVPSTATVASGETISVAVSITSSDKAMNAAQGVLKFPSDLLQVVALSKGGSVLGLWVQEPSFSNAAGTVSFEGIALNPGYIGSNGTVLTVSFRARAVGSAALSIIGASVLANDGSGTEILTDTSGGEIRITAAEERPKEPLPKPRITPEPIEFEESVPSASVPKQKVATIERQFDVSRLVAWFKSADSYILLLLILAFLILNVLIFFQYLRLRKREGGELEHAQVVAHRSFLLLRDDVDTFVHELEEESAKRKLSPVESRFIKEMRVDLTSAEKTIVKELRESEKRIG